MFISNQTKYKEILSTATWAAIHPQVSELVWLRKLYAFKYFRLIGFTKGQITLRKTVVILYYILLISISAINLLTLLNLGP